MGRSQRVKGKRGELEVRNVFRSAGFESDRTPNSGGLHIPADVSVSWSGTDCGLHVEVKRHEKLKLDEWIAQAHDDAPEGCTPIVAWRKNGKEWRADVDLVWLVGILALLQQKG